MLVAAVAAILINLVLLLLRGVTGPTLFDRLLAVNTFGTNIVVLIVLLGYVEDSYNFIDVALIYALINFIATVAFLRYFKYGSFRG